jgi:hypothetical protein
MLGAYAVYTRPYILNHTWYTPRDVVMLFNAAKVAATSSEDQFSIPMFERAIGEYSRQIWSEKEEALLANYAREEVDAIIRMLPNIQRGCTISQFDERAAELANRVPNIARIRAERGLRVVLDDLYSLGIIGNRFKQQGGRVVNRWIYRGNTELLHDQRIAIHDALRPKFFPGEPRRFPDFRETDIDG